MKEYRIYSSLAPSETETLAEKIFIHKAARTNAAGTDGEALALSSLRLADDFIRARDTWRRATTTPGEVR